ncbi:hypothetical protein [Tepidibacter thalassicus]|uniref:Uncharacterized protein n=1 Tax=Tepidibacter thalassicus DSM 15285 TaxID=1123350 RepID=A0A1M5NHH0_9FIRM|nr:hypothetical protein [Tepidibacter thalassicus]SHG88971.1 hypothetical protein SAMN02744040_00042 [Tepidibacter thalassicus DSM 15285]
MKKLIYILNILIAINFFMIIPKCYNNLIDKNTIQNYLDSSQSTEEKENLKKEIIKNILNATGYEKWNEYIDYIDLKIYKGNIIPNNKEDIIFVLNLSKDNALIAIYEDSLNNKYFYKTKITNLVPVKKISFFKNFLVVEQILDERLGAFFVDNFIEIFYYDDNLFKSVFKKSIYYDEIYKNIWVNKNAPHDEWIKNVEKSSIDYLEEDIPKILSITNIIKYKAKSPNIPNPDEFKEINKKTQKELYVWDENEKIFKLKEKNLIKE